MVATDLSNESAVWDKAERIYAEQIRPTLTDADKGRYITVNADTGEYEIDDDDFAGARRARARFGKGAPLLTVRAGYKAVYTMGVGAKDNELPNW